MKGVVGKQTGNRGFGLKTMRPIKKGEFVLEYRGEVRRAAALSLLPLCHH
jgi:SET domain-containing protein